MSFHHKPLVALTLAASLLAGCGASVTVAPAAAVVAASSARAASIASAADSKATALISAYMSISSTDASAASQRAILIEQLGQTNSSAASNFLMDQFLKADALPADQKADLQQKIATALGNLDTYDTSADDAIIAAGPGDTPAQADLYQAAAARRSRHGSIMRFLTAPLHWADLGIRWLYNFLNGIHHSSGGGAPKPKPAGGGSAPAPAPAPAALPTGNTPAMPS